MPIAYKRELIEKGVLKVRRKKVDFRKEGREEEEDKIESEDKEEEDEEEEEDN